MKELSKLQKELKAPKGQRNNFGKYNYRSCEDILEAVKPLLPDGAYINIQDEIVMVGDRFYVKATASFCFDGNCVSSTAFAREPLDRKGMDESQITGATSSYARKYALNGLLCIDDTKDADATNNHGKTEKELNPKEGLGDEKDLWGPEQQKEAFNKAIEALDQCLTLGDATEAWHKVGRRTYNGLKGINDDLASELMRYKDKVKDYLKEKGV